MNTTLDFQTYRKGFRDRKYGLPKDPYLTSDPEYQKGWTTADVAIEDGVLEEKNDAYLE